MNERKRRRARPSRKVRGLLTEEEVRLLTLTRDDLSERAERAERAGRAEDASRLEVMVARVGRELGAHRRAAGLEAGREEKERRDRER